MASQYGAARGSMGGLNFYVTTMKLGELARNVGYTERDVGGGASSPPDLLRQRKLNLTRVRQEMKPYLLDNPDHFFSALLVEVVQPGEPTHEITFVPQGDSDDVGIVRFDGTEKLQALDGQHRLKAIQLALEEQPELAKESIAVVFVPHRGIERSQQLFSDLNRYAKTPSKTISILFEHREFEANAAKAWASSSIAFRDGRTNMESNSLVAKSRHVITLSVLYECVKDLIGRDYAKRIWADQSQLQQDADRTGRELATWYDELVIPNLPDLTDVIAGRLKPVELRGRYLYSHSIGWRTIAKTVRRAKEQRRNWKDLVEQGLKQVDWSLANPEWEGSALVAGTVANRRQNIERAATLLALKLGLDVGDSEKDDLLRAMRFVNPSAVLPQVATGDPELHLAGIG
jgi:DNA sulfur modification protein DndB